MRRTTKMMLVVLALAMAAPLQAEIYSWTDSAGTVHFTEDLGQVPRKERRKVRKLDVDQPSPAAIEAAEAAPAPAVPAVEAPPPGQVNAPAGELYGGKSYAQWQKELADREAAMATVKRRVEEIAATVKDGNLRKDAQQKLIAEHGDLVRQFNDMKSQYNQQVEAARKAGLQVTIQQ